MTKPITQKIDQFCIYSSISYKSNFLKLKLFVNMLDNEPGILPYTGSANKHLQGRDQPYSQRLISFFVGQWKSSLKSLETSVTSRAYNTIAASPPRGVEDP